MRKGDLIWAAALLAVAAFLAAPPTHALFLAAGARHPYLVGFAKFAVLATMGELLALRIAGGAWRNPGGLGLRAAIWGLLGMAIVLVFEVFGAGVRAAMGKGMLPWAGAPLATAFFISAVMNTTFAPTLMLAHRITDTLIDLRQAGQAATLANAAARIDWRGFLSFVLLKSIPLFWIPAHTVTFLLPGEYRVLAAALLSMALGAILAFGKRTVSR